MISKKYDLKARFFYTTLNRAEKKLYRTFVEKLAKQEYEFEFEITPQFIDFYKTYDAVINDFPEFFYADNNAIEWVELGKLRLGCKVYYKPSEIKKIQDKMERILHKFDHITDSFELQVAVTDYICKEYTYSKEYKSEKSRQEMHTLVGPIKRKKGVCSAFTKLAQFIFQRRGIPTVYMIGNSKDKTIPEEDNSHAWLCVKMGGSYYHWDITAMMTDYGAYDLVMYEEFNITDKEKLENYVYEDEIYKTIVCDKTDYNYYVKKGLFFNTYDEIKLSCTKFIKEMDYTKEDFRFDFRVATEIDNEKIIDYLLTKAEIDEILKDTEYTCKEQNTELLWSDYGYCSYKIAIRKK